MTLICHILGILYFALGLLHHAICLYQLWCEGQKSDQA